MRKFNSKFLLFATLLIYCAIAHAGIKPTPLFDIFTEDHGLPAGDITALALDKSGFLWIASSDGLARYDGEGFTLFRHNPDDPNSLPANDLLSIFIDSQDRIWLGVEDGGLSMFDGARNSFTNYKHLSNAQASQLSNVWAINEDQDGFIWVGMYQSGLARLTPSSGAVKFFLHQANDSNSIAANHVLSLMRHPSGQLWVGTTAGLSILKLEGGEITSAQQTLAGAAILSMRATQQHGVLAISTKGLFQIDANDIEVAAQSLKPNRWLSGIEDSEGDLWLSNDAGLTHISKAGDEENLSFQAGIVNGLPANATVDMLIDREGGIWLATLNAGLGYLRPQWRNFSLFQEVVSNQQIVPISNVAALGACDDGKLFAAGRDRWLNQLDFESGKMTRLSEIGMLPAQRMWTILCDKSNNLWLGYHQGIIQLDVRSGKQTRWHADDVAPRKLSGNIVDLMTQTDDGNIWASALENSLNRINPANGTVTQFGVDQGLSIGEVEQLLISPKRQLWVAGRDGIAYFDEVSNTFHKVNLTVRGRIHAIAFADDHHFWVHTLGELAQFELRDEHAVPLQSFRASDGLPVAEIAGLIIEDDKAVWLTGPRGVYRFDLKLKNFHRHGRADGLVRTPVGTRPPVALAQGGWAMPTSIGVLAFQPRKLASNLIPPATQRIATSLRRKGVEVQFDLSQTRLQLRHDDSDLRVELRALSFADSAANRYRFWLENFDSHWIDTGNSGVRVFTQLLPGNYRLRFASSNNTGIWHEADEAISIDVLPPIWKSWSAYFIYAILGLTFVWLAVHGYRQRLVRQHELALAEERQRAAERESEAKSQFLANVGHEIRTPMTGLLGMTDLLLRTPLSDNQTEYVKIVRNAGRGLVKLVNDLLDINRIESGRLTLEESACDIREMIKNIISIETPLALEHGLKIECAVNPNVPQWVMVDSMRLKQVLINLINNALKFTSEGSVSVTVAAELPTYLIYTVSDTGPGIPEESRARLFNRYEQGLRGVAARHGGSGLGLSICRELVVLMGGKIELQSTQGKGTSVSVILPMMVAEAPDSDLPAQSISSKQLRIILVDDDAIARQTLTELLRSLGHQVSAVENGLHALNLLRDSHFDMGFFDLDLPGVDGLQLAEFVRSHQTSEIRMPLVAITARSEYADEASCLKAGFDRFVRKPLGIDELIDSINVFWR